MITGSIVGKYITELFIAWYSELKGAICILTELRGLLVGLWSMMTCNVFSPQFMWFKK